LTIIRYRHLLSALIGGALGEKSKTRAITAAIQEFIRQKKITDLLALRGKVKIDYDWKKEEEREIKPQQKREKLLERKK